MEINHFLEENKIKNEQDLFKYLNEQKFTWWIFINWVKDKEIKREEYLQSWKLKNIENIIEDRGWICWDFANFEKRIFDKLGLKSNIYYIVFGDDIYANPVHNFTVIDKWNELVLFEYSFRKRAWIYPMENFAILIESLLNWLYENNEKLDNKNVTVYKFSNTFPENINTKELLELAKKQEVVYGKFFDKI